MHRIDLTFPPTDNIALRQRSILILTRGYKKCKFRFMRVSDVRPSMAADHRDVKYGLLSGQYRRMEVRGAVPDLDRTVFFS